MHYIRQQPRKGTALREVDQDVLPEIKVFQEGERSAYDGEVVVTDHDFHSMKHRSGDGLVLVPYMYSPFDTALSSDGLKASPLNTVMGRSASGTPLAWRNICDSLPRAVDWVM
jgi:hypothetical protein